MRRIQMALLDLAEIFTCGEDPVIISSLVKTLLRCRAEDASIVWMIENFLDDVSNLAVEVREERANKLLTTAHCHHMLDEGVLDSFIELLGDAFETADRICELCDFPLQATYFDGRSRFLLGGARCRPSSKFLNKLCMANNISRSFIKLLEGKVKFARVSQLPTLIYMPASLRFAASDIKVVERVCNVFDASFHCSCVFKVWFSEASVPPLARMSSVKLSDS